ncbi:acyl-CoA thioesterase [Marinobacter changyiensis]|uniref:acyl-CoA thioesterase n=1 Tax=Marinobacter changyiensis TaxID=2604091 RepID=UPI001264C6C5|nr:thioesterase family protein [Marinobacter changyiensis]
MKNKESPLHPLDQAVALQPIDQGRWQGTTSQTYANMVGPFGGTTGATLLQGALSHNELLGEPVSLTVNFAAPVADGNFEVVVRPLRTNRNSQHWWAEMVQGGQVVAFATAVTARRRDTWEQTEAAFPDVPLASDLPAFTRDAAPPWTRNYDMRFVDGELLGEPDKDYPSRSRVWMRDQPSRPLDYVSLSALCDAFFPRIYIRRPKLVPIGTVSLTTYFHAGGEQLASVGSDHILGVARANHFGKGFFDQSAEVWSRGGALLATTHQVVYFKE